MEVIGGDGDGVDAFVRGFNGVMRCFVYVRTCSETTSPRVGVDSFGVGCVILLHVSKSVRVIGALRGLFAMWL